MWTVSSRCQPKTTKQYRDWRTITISTCLLYEAQTLSLQPSIRRKIPFIPGSESDCLKFLKKLFHRKGAPDRGRGQAPDAKRIMKIPLNPPFSKGEVEIGKSFPPLAKGGWGDLQVKKR